MGNNNEMQFDFCPKCGALARGGVCTSCGYGSVPVTEEAVPVAETEPVVVEEVPVAEAEPVVEEAVPVAETEPIVEEEVPVAKEVVSQEQNPYVPYTAQTTYTTPNANSNTYTNQGMQAAQSPYAAQNPYTAQNPQSAQNPYTEYVNRTAYTNGAIPADVPAKKSNGKVWAIILTCVGVFILLIVLLCVAVFNLVSKIDDNTDNWEESWNEEFDFEEDYNFDYEDENDYSYDEDEVFDYDEFYNDITERAKENRGDEEEPPVSADGKTYGFSPEDDYYYELKTILRDDLDYSVTIEEDTYSNDTADIYCSYPVLEGDIPNIDYLNQVIYDEYLYFVEYYEENVKDYLWEDEYFYTYVEGYVPYMDEEKISIVFAEEAEYSDYFIVALYCINIDVKNGVVIDNTSILDVDDEFSVDFRIREAEQNQSDALDYYTDQELTEMLTDPIDLIVFYTPLGLEVGINHDMGWSTTTYKDYEDFLKHF